jgi:hypothetical protein
MSIGCADFSSQIGVSVQPGFNSFGGEMQLMPDKTLRVIGIASHDWWFGRAFVSTVHFNLSGQMISVKVFPEISLEEAWDLRSFPTKKGHSIVVADITGCDFGTPVTIGSISDTDTIVWYHSPFDHETSVSGSFHLRQVRDTLFRVWDSQHEEFYSLNGVKVLPPIEHVIYDEILLTNDGFVMSADSILTICDTTFNPLAFISLSSEIQAFDTITASGYFCATRDSLYILNSSLQILNSKKLPVIEAERVFTTSSDFWVVERYTNLFYRLDSLMEVIATYQLDPRVELSDILHIADTVFVSGNFTGRDQSMVLFRTTQDDFSLDLPTDIGIVKTRLTELATSTNIDWGWGGYPVRNVYYGPVYITLRNYGTTTIDETYVRFQEYACPGVCAGILQYEWHLTGLNLSPGAAQEVFLDYLSFDCTFYDVNQLCLYTINPNGEPDVHTDNDDHCIQVDVISDVAETTPGRGISVYPNPASEWIYLDYSDNVPAGTVKIALIDSNGRQVWRNPDHEFTTRVPLNDIPPGMYFLVIQFGSDQPVMEKVVVL